MKHPQRKLFIVSGKVGLAREDVYLTQTMAKLLSLPPELCPDRKGEDFKERFDGIIDDVMLRNWQGLNSGNPHSLGVLSVGRRKPNEIIYGAEWRLGSDPDCGTSFYANAPAALFEEQTNFNAWVKLLRAEFDLFGGDFGYMRSSLEPIESPGLAIGLPGLFFMNLFGPSYVKFFGRKKLLEAPCFSADEIGPDVICIRMGNHIREVTTEEYKSRIQNAKAHLGEDTFIALGEGDLYNPDLTKSPKRCRTPEFDRSKVIAGFEHVQKDKVREDPYWTYSISNIKEYCHLRDHWREYSRDFQKKMQERGIRLPLSVSSFKALDDYLVELKGKAGGDWTCVKEELRSIAIFVGDVLSTKFRPADFGIYRGNADNEYTSRVDYCHGNKPSSEFPFVLVMDSWNGKKKLSDWRPLRQAADYTPRG